MPELQGPRLRLREWRSDDIDAWLRLCEDPNLWRFPYQRQLSREEASEHFEKFIAHWDEHGFGLWAVELADTGELIGEAGLAYPTWFPEIMPTVEVGWRFGTDWWGNGYATEAGGLALDFGFTTLSLQQIISIAEPENPASIRVMERLGMTLDHPARHPTRDLTLVVYSIAAP